MTAPVRSRPTLITVLIVLVVLGGIGQIITGIIVLSAGGSALAGIFAVVVGLAYFAVAKGLADGDPSARVIVAIVAALQVISAILVAIVEHQASGRISGTGSGIIGVAVLIILFSGAGNAWFGSRRS